jgi:hypothetical protein
MHVVPVSFATTLCVSVFCTITAELQLVLNSSSTDLFCIEAVSIEPALVANYSDHATVMPSIALQQAETVERAAMHDAL